MEGLSIRGKDVHINVRDVPIALSELASYVGKVTGSTQVRLGYAGKGRIVPVISQDDYDQVIALVVSRSYVALDILTDPVLPVKCGDLRLSDIPLSDSVSGESEEEDYVYDERGVLESLYLAID
jgi:hypothetical protein